jgi:hypothetical protein
VDARERRLAEKEALFREINEHLEEMGGGLAPLGGRSYEFLCECAARRCERRIALTRDRYEQIRANPRRFALAAGHELPDLETVVERVGDVVVTEKRGEAGRAGRAPRSARARLSARVELVVALAQPAAR